MATIYRRRSGDRRRWGVTIRVKGLPTEHKTFPNKATAARWAAKREAEIREGRNLYQRQAERHTFGELVRTYLEVIAPYGRKIKSLPRQAAHLGWWAGRLGNHRLIDVTPAVIGDCKRRLLREPCPRTGRRRGPATVNRYLAALSRVMTIAVKELGWIDSNPVRRVERLTEPRGRVRFLSDDERERLLAACRRHPNRLLHPLVAMALGTGGRRGELLGLRWSDVVLRPGEERVTFRDTKNGETRSVPLTGLALAAVHELRAVRRLGTDRLFPSRDGTRPASVRHAFLSAVRSAQLEDFRFHDLRHTFASYLAMSGATLAEIAEALGHKTLSMVKRYAHLSDQHTRQVVCRMHEKFLASG